jgi:hypothetical protein
MNENDSSAPMVPLFHLTYIYKITKNNYIADENGYPPWQFKVK